MAAEDLIRSEEAVHRARQCISQGEIEKACKAYLEAAEHMLRFSQTQQGRRRADAQRLVQQLVEKAKSTRADGKWSDHRTDADTSSGQRSGSDAVPKSGKEKSGDNQSAISQDLESWRHGDRSGRGGQGKFIPVESPNVHFSDIAGMEKVKSIVRLKLVEPILHPEVFERFSKASNGGILLYGPPGTGKTMIARAIATETQLDFYSVRCSDIVGKGFGDGERNLKELFEAARDSGRAMIFFDEFEALACKRGGGSTVMNRIVPELLSQLDGFQKAEGTLVVLAATNRPWDLDSAVLRPPRMTERIYVGLPDFEARRYMVQKELGVLPKREELDYDSIAERLEGFNCADIVAFVERIKDALILRSIENSAEDQFLCPQDIEDVIAVSHSSVQKADLEAFSRWEATQR